MCYGRMIDGLGRAGWLTPTASRMSPTYVVALLLKEYRPIRTYRPTWTRRHPHTHGRSWPFAEYTYSAWGGQPAPLGAAALRARTHHAKGGGVAPTPRRR